MAMPGAVDRHSASAERRRVPVVDWARVLFVNGIVLLVLTLFMLPPTVTDLIAEQPEWRAFAAAGFISGFLGLTLVLATRERWSHGISLKEGFVLTVSAWVVLPVVAALPFLFMGLNLGVADAWFESVSGLTTTGSTILTGLDSLPPGILLWRSTLHWVGGIGIMVMVLVMLPFLRVGGMQLFRAESSDRSEKFVPRPRELVSLIALTYGTLTVLCAVSYYWAGMSGFDALNYAMSTVSTGGFATHDLSFGYFHQPALPWIGSFFMLASALPLLLYAKMVRSRSLDLFRDPQVRALLKLVAIVVMGLTAYRVIEHGVPLGEALRTVTFNVISIITTTGFAFGDYTLWGSAAVGVFLIITFLGGCTGSTSGGIKMFRLQLMLIAARGYLRQLTSPNRVIVLTYNGRQITPDVLMSVLAFITILFATVMFGTLVLSLFGLDMVTSFTGAAQAVANVGPGLGHVIGPAGTFAPLPDGAKYVLALSMLLGRLEFFTLLALLSRDFWR